MNFRRVRTLLPIPFWSCEIPSLSSLSFFFPPRKNDWIDLQFLLSLLKKNQFWTLSYVKGFPLWNQNRSIHLVFEFNPIRGKKKMSQNQAFLEKGLSFLLIWLENERWFPIGQWARTRGSSVPCRIAPGRLCAGWCSWTVLPGSFLVLSSVFPSASQTVSVLLICVLALPVTVDGMS